MERTPKGEVGGRSRFLVSVQNMPSAVWGGCRAEALTFHALAPGYVQIPPTDLCTGKKPQIIQSRALSPCQDHHKDKDRQTNKNITCKGEVGGREGKKQGRRNSRKIK